MNRREVIGLGLVAAAATGVSGRANAVKAAPASTATGLKAWAAKNFKGVSSLIYPSFTTDLTGLDEEGIRADVRHSMAQRLYGVEPFSAGLTPEETKRFNEIVVSEAAGRLSVGRGALAGNRDPRRSHKVLRLPEGETEDEVYEKAAAVAHESRDVPMFIYIAERQHFTKFNPNGLPMKAIDRLADLPNVVASKLSQTLDRVTMSEVADMIGNRLDLGPVDVSNALWLAGKGRVSFTGDWSAEVLQGPQKPYVVEFFDQMARRNLVEATKIYYAMRPVSDFFYDLQGPTLKRGGHPWHQMKYMKRLTGGNGGMLRPFNQPEVAVPSLTAEARKRCREAYMRAGIMCTDLPDEAYAVGNANYARGARLKDIQQAVAYRA